MNYIEFNSQLRAFPVFSISDIRAVEPDFDRRRLTEWQYKGYIKKIIKGHYIFSDSHVDENLLFHAANKIYRPSYVSLETALARYGLIPENVWSVTSVATRRTYTFETPITRFFYRTIHKKLFFGYVVREKRFKLASMEKALIDFFYLNTGYKTADDFAELRINEDVLLEKLDEERLFDYLKRVGRKNLTSRITKFLEWMRDAGH